MDEEEEKERRRGAYVAIDHVLREGQEDLERSNALGSELITKEAPQLREIRLERQ